MTSVSSDGPAEGTREWFDELVNNRHASTRHLVRYFAHAHLPEGPLRTISAWHGGLALKLIDELPDSPELTAGLRKLLEAKDCFVRATVDREADAVEQPRLERCPSPGTHPPHHWHLVPGMINPTGALFQAPPGDAELVRCDGSPRNY